MRTCNSYLVQTSHFKIGRFLWPLISFLISRQSCVLSNQLTSSFISLYQSGELTCCGSTGALEISIFSGLASNSSLIVGLDCCVSHAGYEFVPWLQVLFLKSMMTYNVFFPEQAADCSSAFFLASNLFWCPDLFVLFIFKSYFCFHFTFILRSYTIFKF